MQGDEHQLMPAQQGSFHCASFETQLVPHQQGGPLVMAVVPAEAVPVSQIVECWQGLPVCEPGEDLGKAYLRYCNAHLAHMRTHLLPLAEAHYNMARCLSLGVHCGAIPGLPPCVDGTASPEEIAEGRMELALEQLRSAAVAGFVDHERAKEDEDLAALREARPRSFADLLRRMQGLPTVEECGEALAVREAVEHCGGAVALGEDEDEDDEDDEDEEEEEEDDGFGGLFTSTFWGRSKARGSSAASESSEGGDSEREEAESSGGGSSSGEEEEDGVFSAQWTAFQESMFDMRESMRQTFKWKW